MSFPQTRLRRLRANHALRGLVRETRLEAADFVYPMFVAHGSNTWLRIGLKGEASFSSALSQW